MSDADPFLYPQGYADEAVRDWANDPREPSASIDIVVRRACTKTAVETLCWAARSWEPGSDVHATLTDLAESLELLGKEKDAEP